MSDIHIQRADWSRDQASLIALRTEVFVEEQKVPVSLEVDGLDPQCQHVKACDADGHVVGTARLLPNHYIGRMCVRQDYRGQGVGGRMLQYFIDLAQQQDTAQLMLNAQISAIEFYRRYGFEADSDIFMEADIAHRHMTLNLSE